MMKFKDQGPGVKWASDGGIISRVLPPCLLKTGTYWELQNATEERSLDPGQQLAKLQIRFI